MARGPNLAASSPVVSPVSLTLAVTTASATTSLPDTSGRYDTVNVLNDGAATLFFVLGAGPATNASIPVPAGKCLSLYAAGKTSISALGSAATTLRLTQSNGIACPR